MNTLTFLLDFRSFNTLRPLEKYGQPFPTVVLPPRSNLRLPLGYCCPPGVRFRHCCFCSRSGPRLVPREIPENKVPTSSPHVPDVMNYIRTNVIFFLSTSMYQGVQKHYPTSSQYENSIKVDFFYLIYGLWGYWI